MIFLIAFLNYRKERDYLNSAWSFDFRLPINLFMMASICLSLSVRWSSCRMKFTA